MAITGCIKQNLIVFKPKKKLLCKEYLCGCTFCLQFDFENCSNENAADNGEDDADLEEFDESLIILNRFLFFLFSGPTNEPLFVVQITGKGVAQEDISDPYGHFFS